jgi:putative addiction module antidote
MQTTLKVIQVGNSLGIILNEDALQVLGVKEGDELILTSEGGGFRVTPADPTIRAQLESARGIIRKRHDALAELAKK